MRLVIIAIMIMGFVSMSFGLDLSMENITGGSEERVTFRMIDEKESFSFKVVRSVPMGTAFIRVWSAPRGSTFINDTFRWTPGEDQSGMYNVTFSTTEPVTGNQVYSSIRLVVADTYFDIRYNKLYEKLFTATDPDADKVTITITGLPTGAIVTGSQFSPKLFSWRPTKRQIGNHQILVTATDYPEAGSEPKRDISIVHIRVTKSGGPSGSVSSPTPIRRIGPKRRGGGPSSKVKFATMEQLVNMTKGWLNHS